MKIFGESGAFFLQGHINNLRFFKSIELFVSTKRDLQIRFLKVREFVERMLFYAKYDKRFVN